MSIYSIITAHRDRKAGEDGIYIYVDEHDMPAEYDDPVDGKVLFGNGLYFIPRQELYRDGLLGGIEEDIPIKIIKNPEKYCLEVDALTLECNIIPREGRPGERKNFETKFRFY